MAWADRPGVRWLIEAAEQRVGVAVRPASEVRRLQTVEQEFGEFRDEAEDLAYHAMDYFSGRPSEMRAERRRRLAQRSRIALLEDPLAGAEAQLLGDFAFGKGVSLPTARNPKVQDVIDEAWTDANNEEKLTGYAAQRRLSNELLTSGELFVTLYTAGGKVRVGRLDPDLVENVVPDPEDRLRPLWYVTRVRRYEWDYENDQPKLADELSELGAPKVEYWKHWRNVDDAIHERETADTSGETPLELPPEEKIAKGVVLHVAINQTGEQLRGNPPWARSLRFFSAMNVLTEAHVTMAQAASTFIARRVMKGSPRQITKAANSIISSVGELGAARLGGAGAGEPTTQPFAPGQQPPAAPGSWWSENQESKLEALNLQSGAGQMAQTAQIVRAPIAAAAGFGQHYLGDASNANLATASTLELPANMHVESWQEWFSGIYRWFTDRAIEAAVQAGRLGGAEGFKFDKPLGEMRLHEAEDRTAMEERTGKELSYEFTMPFPGRRQLPDVAAFAESVLASNDPNGVNIPMRRTFLRFVFEQMGVDDVARAVEECIPEEGVPGGVGDISTMIPPAPPPGAPGAQGTGGNPEQVPPEGQQPNGAKSNGTQMAEQEWIPADLRGSAVQHGQDIEDLFGTLVMNPAMLATLELAGASNGNGASS